MNCANIKFRKLNNNATVPTRGSNNAAGYDLYACLDTEYIVVPSHATVKIGTGLSFELPEGTFAALFARSGIATKRGLRPANAVGVADSDYRGEYIIALHNDTDINQVVINGERIAQMVLMPYIQMSFEEEELSKTERGVGGFGSTGK